MPQQEPIRVGISSSCFYPLETELALRRVGEAGAKRTEIFFNSPSEIEPPFLNELDAIRAAYAMEVVSIHPFLSFAEGYNLFSEYRRRFWDSLPLYQRLFDAAARLGANRVVLHGARHLVIEEEDYAERFLTLQKKAKETGVQIAHENVVHYVGQSPAFLARMRALLGDAFPVVLDLKQARRAGEDPFDFVRALQNAIVHVHVSDGDALHDCLPPGRGAFDFCLLRCALAEAGVRDAAWIIELYRRNFRSDSELTAAQAFLRSVSDPAGQPYDR